MSDLADAIAQEARLWILKELAAQADGHLNEIIIARLLERKYGINRSREWVRTQLHKLAELGAVEKLGTEELVIARILRGGRDHLAGRSVIAGITRPHEVE